MSTHLWGIDYTLPNDRNAFTEDLLRSKRSLAADLSRPEGVEIVHRLVKDADVFLTNMRPATVTRTQLDYEHLSSINSRLVYCHGTAFGDTGPEKDSPGNEMMGLARSGMMLGSAPAGSEPVYPTAGINDRLGAIGMAFGILAALVDRQRTGVGQLVETSLLGWMVNLQVVGAQIAANTGQDPRPTPRDDANDPLYNYYRCGDGTWIALGMLGYGNRFWPHLCTALGRPDLSTDDRFADQDSRELNRRALIAILDECFARLSFEEWDRLAKQHDFISTKVNALTDLVTDEQVLANGYLEQQPHPDLGTWWYAPTPIRFHRTPVSIRSAAPHCGQDNHSVLEDAGYSPDETHVLEKSEVV